MATKSFAERDAEELAERQREIALENVRSIKRTCIRGLETLDEKLATNETSRQSLLTIQTAAETLNTNILTTGQGLSSGNSRVPMIIIPRGIILRTLVLGECAGSLAALDAHDAELRNTRVNVEKRLAEVTAQLAQEFGE